ncbi:MAG TPA: hypothetical protein ENI26_06225 [Methylophaga aminisulfidivorans]|uniref:Uncharacterized protein n=1 Tax=Methylophaga aminisulfidivorans TaxID=230105 RepID=A0A7C1W4U4_9GAMM|nr:hypothetical protein [Methylophaga aminisulfidivorans]
MLTRAQAKAGITSRIEAFLQERRISLEIVGFEEKRQVILQNQIDLLNNEAKVLNQELASIGVSAKRRSEISLILLGILNRQKLLTSEIIKSKTAVVGLRDAFSQVLNIVSAAAGELVKFFQAIDLNKVAQLIGGFKRLFEGLKQIKGADGVGGFLRQLSDVFKLQRKEAGGGLLGTIAGIADVITKAIPVIGAFVEFGIQVGKALKQIFPNFSKVFIAGLITGNPFLLIIGGLRNAAIKMANDIRKQIKRITEDFKSGATELGATITDLEAQRARTFELERKKGGKGSARKLRAEIEAELQELRKQQKEILEGFQFDLGLRRIGAGFQSFARDVQKALKTVQEFLGAGGTLAQASEFLSLVLRDLRDTLTGDVRDAQVEVLERARDLIDLERAREELIKENEQRIRDILSEGLVERDLTVAQRKARSLAEQTDEFAKQLIELEQQIELSEALLAVERSIVDASIDLQDAEVIRGELLRLNVLTRQQEVELIQQQAEILAGITEDAGRFFLSEDLFRRLTDAGIFAGIGPRETNIIINFPLTGPGTLTQSQEELLQELLEDIFNTNPEKFGGSSPV